VWNALSVEERSRLVTICIIINTYNNYSQNLSSTFLYRPTVLDSSASQAEKLTLKYDRPIKHKVYKEKNNNMKIRLYSSVVRSICCIVFILISLPVMIVLLGK